MWSRGVQALKTLIESVQSDPAVSSYPKGAAGTAAAISPSRSYDSLAGKVQKQQQSKKFDKRTGLPGVVGGVSSSVRSHSANELLSLVKAEEDEVVRAVIDIKLGII